MRDNAQKNRRTTSAGQLGGSAPTRRNTTQTGSSRITQAGDPRTTQASPLRRTTPGFMTTGVTQIHPVRPPATPSRAMVPVSPRRGPAPPDSGRFGQLLDDITLLIAVLGVVVALACTLAAVMGWI